MDINLCLPVPKYFYLEGVDPSGKSAWNHLQHNDMFVLVKGHEADGTMMMTLFAGNSRLESIDIGSYVDNAIRGRQIAESKGSTVRSEHLPIFGITKGAAFAIRWRLSTEVTRKIQLKLQSPADCRQLAALFERRGMEIDGRPGTSAARPNTSSTRPVSSQADFRPLTAQSSSPFFISQQTTQGMGQQGNSPTKFNPAMGPPTNARSIQEDEDLYGLSPRRHARNSTAQAPVQGLQISTEMHRSDEQDSRNYYGASLQEVKGPYTRDEATAPREVVPSRPSTAQLYRSQTTQPKSMNEYRPQEDAVEPGLLRASSSSNTANLDSIRQAFEDRETASNAGSDMRPQSAHPTRQHLSPVAIDAQSTPFTSSGPFEPRPQTGISAISSTSPNRQIHQNETLDRPASRSNGSRPGSSALDLPPLKRPNLVKETSVPRTANSISQQTSIRPGNAVPLSQSVPTGTAQRPSSERRVNVHPRERNCTMLDRLAPPPLYADENLDRRFSPMDNLLYGSRPLAERSNNAGLPRLTSDTDAPHEIETPPQSAHQAADTGGSIASAAVKAATAHNDALGRVSMAINPDGAGAPDLSLEQYAAQSGSDREAILANFMIENLSNPAFITLCEDVENCWQRL